MTRAACTTPPQDLLAYWLGELDGEFDRRHEQRLEEHLFACAACTERLGAVVALGASIRAELLRGTFNFVTSVPFINRIKEAGWQVREYDLPSGGSVACTVTPDDDFVVSYLRAPLRDVRRLDVLIDDSTSGKHRANDVAFDAEAGTLAAVTSTVYLRTLGHSQQRVRLVAVEGTDERVIADYIFKPLAILTRRPTAAILSQFVSLHGKDCATARSRVWRARNSGIRPAPPRLPRSVKVPQQIRPRWHGACLLMRDLNYKEV